MSNLINHVIRRTMSSGGIVNVAIIGAGLMGSGIAQVFRGKVQRSILFKEHFF